MATAKMTASNEQVLLIVNNLETYPYIWDTILPDFYNKDKKASDWRQLSILVGLDEKDVRRTYETIRKKFRQVSEWVMTESVSDWNVDLRLLLTRHTNDLSNLLLINDIMY